jgi:hypothetical protein
MTMSPTTTEKRPKLAFDYTAFIGSLSLHTINLKETSCEIDRDAFWKGEDRSIAYKFTAEPIGTAKEEYFDARARLEVTVAGDKSKSNMVKIAATFDLHVHAKATPKEYVKKFCDSEIRLIVWPYFREFVMDISGRMYIPPIILPLSDKKEE